MRPAFARISAAPAAWSTNGISTSAPMPVRSAISANAPNWGAATRMNRKDPPHNAASRSRLATSRRCNSEPPLEAQQCALALDPAGVAGERTVAADDAVAWHDHRDGVAADGAADRAHAARRTGATRHLGVAQRPAVRDLHQLRPHAALERRSVEYDRQLERGTLAVRVLSDLPSGRHEHRPVVVAHGAGTLELADIGLILLADEVQPGEPLFLRNRQDLAETRTEQRITDRHVTPRVDVHRSITA